MKATKTKPIGVIAQKMRNSAGFIFRSARARSVASRAVKSCWSMTRESPATTADSESPSSASAPGSLPDAYRSSRDETPPPPALMAMPTAMTTIANAAIPAIRSGSMPMVRAVPSG